MDFTLSETQADVRGLFADFLRDRCSTEVVRAAEPASYDARLWDDLRGIGALSMGVSEAAGGAGAGLQELILAAAQVGARIAPVPFIEAVTAARLLDRLDTPDADAALADALSGARLVTFSPRPLPAGHRSGLVPSGAIADAIAGLRDGELVLAELAGAPPRPCPQNLGSMPLADTRLAAVATLASGEDAVAAYGSAADEWRVLMGAALVGIAERALEIALEYVKIRRAFGTLIGSFQTVAHRLADDVVQLDGARFLCYEAAWAADEQTAQGQALASMAFLYATETARRITGDSLHFHGGVGFTMEHDIQLYFRRAKAWPQVNGDPRQEYQRLADRLFGARTGAVAAA